MKQWLVRRGLFAPLPVVALVLGFGACSSESPTPGSEQQASSARTGATLPQVNGVELEVKPAATQRFTRLNQQFTRVPLKAPAAPLLKQALPGLLPANMPPGRPDAEASPVLRKGEANAFVRQGDRFRAQIEPLLKEHAMLPATVDLPATADGFVRVQPDHTEIGVEFATKHAKPHSDIEVAEGVATYAGGAPEGGDMAYRVTVDSVEDFVVLNQKPSTPRVDYTVKVGEVAGLRLYDNVLEFLDAKGVPQIRVKPPRVIDSDGVIHEAFVGISGCKFDDSAIPPMDRAVTAPGAKSCDMSVTWDDSKVVYPAIVDPVWATAASLAFARYRSGAVRLADGRILTCGGINDIGVDIKSCEVYTPAANAAGSWATAPAMNVARSDHQMFMLNPASTDVIAVGGNGTYTSERITSALASWTNSTGDFGTVSGCPSCTPYFSPQTASMTSDGKWIVLVDYAATPYRLNTATNAWSTGTQNTGSAQLYRYSAMIFAIPGKATIMRLGGNYSSTYYASGERYDPAADSWTVPGVPAAMTVPRYGAAVAQLDSNRVMVYGGYNSSGNLSTAEIYSGSGNTWAFSTGPLPGGYSASQSYYGLTAAFHGSGKMLSNAGNGPMFLYDPAAASAPWATINAVNFNNLGSQANILTAGTRVLMVPVWPITTPPTPSGAQTACRLFDFGDKGSQCTSSTECQSGLTCVVDPYVGGYGVCCDSACTGGCSSCQAAHKTSGTGDGTCGPRKATEGDSTTCPYQDPSTCGNVGYTCDGAGGCKKWDTSYQCGNNSCLDGDTMNNTRYCDGAGACAKQTTTDCATGYSCYSGYCQTQCYNQSDYCAANYYCQDFKNPYYTCQPKKSAGTSCLVNYECSSGYCVDGVCCDKACNGTCEGCTNALTGKTTGSCNFISAAAGAQPDCYDNGVATCGQTGTCNGAGACQLYANGSVCAGASCAGPTSRNVPDTCNGTGTCTDNGIQNCAAGYSCLSGVCQTSCTDDTQCASNYYCDLPTKQCVADKTQGQACVRDAACPGNANCVDGVCCESACGGTCRSCLKNRTGLASDGLCGNTLDDTDPENECATDVGYPASCKAPGLCTGAGTCRVYAKPGIVAKPDTCSGTTLSTYSCDGAGNLTQLETPCYPYKCNAGGTACRVACTTGTEKTDCDDTSFCGDGGKCIGVLPLGAACTAGTQCKSTYCADVGKGKLEGDPDPDPSAGGDGSVDTTVHPGVCCDQFCGGSCEGCKKSTKGQGSDGSCAAVADHYDLKGDCQPDAANPCGHNGECDGARGCRNTPNGTSCGTTTCIGNTARGQICSEGACINDSAIACAPYLCRDVNGAHQCTNPCSNDTDCQDGFYCDAMECKKKLAPGATCESSALCASGFCVDGVCCDVSCKGQCEACDVAGSEGVCSPVQGVPHGMRPVCDHAGDECGGQCDGVNSTSCKYAPNGTSCGVATCNNDLATSAACNGQGECKPNKNTECSPYVCGPDDTCLSRCEQDADCSQGYTCDETTQRCLPAAVTTTCSDDRQSSVGQNGLSTPCKPFLCVPSSGSCAFSCAFSTDCADGFVCEPSSKTCLPAPTDTGDDGTGSCACRAAGATPDNHSSYWALAALGVALSGLRRRRQTKPRRKTAKPRSALAFQPFE